MNDVALMLNKLKVPTQSASIHFKEWLSAYYPDWRFADDFTEVVPREWHKVAKGDFDLCYLATEEIIMGVVQSSFGANLLPVGALMSGDYLAVDTRDDKRMTVGRLNQMRGMGDVGEVVSRSLYYSFKMSYPEWMAQIWENPEDLRYL